MLLDGLLIFLGGVLFFIVAICVSMNTSMGGTRSDYRDGSGLIFYMGAALIGLGFGFVIVEVVG